MRIEDHEPAGLGAVRVDGRFQLAEREVLEPRVDREREGASGLRRANRLDVLDDLAATVDDHAAAARLAAEPLLLRELDSLLSHVAVAGEAQDVAHRVAAGIEAAVFGLIVDAFDLQCGDTGSDLRRNLLREEHEVAAVVEFPGERLWRRFQRQREQRALVGRRVDLSGKGPDGFHRSGDRERLAGTIDDAATMRRHFDLAAVARAPLLLQKRVVDPLQVEGTADERGEQ